MIDKLIETFTDTKLVNDAESIVIPKEEKYLTAYQEFIRYFGNIDKLTKHNTIIGISFTYSWMPTILDFRSDKIGVVTNILNNAKKGNIPNLEDLESLRCCFNNSLVGSSKLLHFINPEKFAIWDSRVYRYLFNNSPHSYRVENKSTYLTYLLFCDYLINKPIITKLQEIVEKKVGYSLTNMRIIELIFFYNGNKY